MFTLICVSHTSLSPQELIRRGYDVIAFSREQAGIKGKMGKEDIAKVKGGEDL